MIIEQMSKEQIRYLSKIKKLVSENHCRFLSERDTRNYIDDLMDIGISVEEAWYHIMQLKPAFYNPDRKPNYNKKGEDALLFKKPINGYIVYIKLKIEVRDSHEETVCISFHKDHDSRR